MFSVDLLKKSVVKMTGECRGNVRCFNPHRCTEHINTAAALPLDTTFILKASFEPHGPITEQPSAARSPSIGDW
jgi:hypothetical protein